jgi:monomeric sarcosine oxidase
MPNYDVIVLGAGAMGCAAAYYLSLQNKNVLLLEQFNLEHEKGSSQDHSRIIRYSYDNPIYIQLMKEAFPLWFALEEKSGQELYVRTGGIDIGNASEKTYAETQNSLTTMNIPFEVLNASDSAKRFPQFRFDDNMEIIYQKDTGLLAATRCVKTHLTLAQQNGVTFRENAPVTKIISHTDSVEIEAGGETYHAAKLIISAGAWTNHVLKHLDIQLPLEPVGVQLAYFSPETTTMFDVEQMPVFITHLKNTYGDWVYGIPSYQGSGVKVAFHGGQRVKDVNDIDYDPKDSVIERLREYTSSYLPQANAPLKATRICLYTMTPDEHFIIDKHPTHDHIIVATPCSGHGFKFSTLIGKMLSELALDGTTQHDTSLFKITRYL